MTTSLLPVEVAQKMMLEGLAPLTLERVPIAEADGRVLAEDLFALRTQPPFALSAMDGYAVRACDAQTGALLRIVGESVAGRRFQGTLSAGAAVRIFTGAVVPASADCILIQENARALGQSIEVLTPPRPGAHIRVKGLDFVEGAQLLSKGTRLGMREIALAAAMNHASLPVHRRPRVALIASGDELVLPGVSLGEDQIVASNGLALSALIRAAGGEALDLGIARDRMEVLEACIQTALAKRADILCVIGGASVGDHDLTRAALTTSGFALGFWKIAMRPGKPLMFGTRGQLRALGLPGNPVSSLVCGLLFLAPLIRALSGMTELFPEEEPALLGSPLPANDGRQDYIRAKLARDSSGALIAIPFSVQDSSMLSTFAESNALIIRAPGADKVDAGERVKVIRLG